jgi:hypothetical protein
MIRALTTLLALLALLAMTTVADARGFTFQKVRGGLEAEDAESKAKGRFALLAVTSAEKKGEKLLVVARGLDKDTDYDVVLEDADGNAYTFGEMRVFRRGHGLFRFSSKRHDLPEGVDGLADFSGGSLSVASGETTVLSGDIPAFVDPGTSDEPGEGSLAFGVGAERLEKAEGTDLDAAAKLYAVAVNTWKGARERLSLYAIGLDRDEEYGVYVGDEKIGTLRPWSRFGIARLVLDTGRGHDLPDHLSSLAGKAVEVRDPAGDAVLTGEFPALR